MIPPVYNVCMCLHARVSLFIQETEKEKEVKKQMTTIYYNCRDMYIFIHTQTLIPGHVKS